MFPDWWISSQTLEKSFATMWVYTVHCWFRHTLKATLLGRALVFLLSQLLRYSDLFFFFSFRVYCFFNNWPKVTLPFRRLWHLKMPLSVFWTSSLRKAAVMEVKKKKKVSQNISWLCFVVGISALVMQLWLKWSHVTLIFLFECCALCVMLVKCFWWPLNNWNPVM